MPYREIDIEGQRVHLDAVASLYAWGIQIIAGIFTTGNMLLGWVLVLAPNRLATLGFQQVLMIASARVWGTVFIASGLVGLFGQLQHRRWPTRLAHGLSGFMCLWWAGAFTAAAVHDPRSGLTGVVAYGYIIALTHLTLAIVSPHR